MRHPRIQTLELSPATGSTGLDVSARPPSDAAQVLARRTCLGTLGWEFALVLLLSWISAVARAAVVPQEVEFASRDGRTQLKGYAFVPASAPPWPAVVMLHGRSGPYSTLANGTYEASTLSMRHKQWGAFWAERGYLALHVDSFGPRGYPDGFPFGSYAQRPPEVNEQTVRPLDAYGALDYLRRRDDVIKDRIGLQGWSNGAMAGLATLAAQPPGMSDPTPSTGFRAALLFYPACRIQLGQQYRPYAPAVMFVGSEDEEITPGPCRGLAQQARARGVAHFELVWYDGATHSFDDPGGRRQSLEANRRARTDAMRLSEAFFRRHLQLHH
jgi:dienelactone hydrolase